MPSACNTTGIIPNPDISGIGVRAAIYAQAVLTLIQPILASMDGHISEKELIGLHRLYLGILLPGCALLVSAIIQATTQGLSVYHAVIVLQLSWINNTSALIFFQFALIAQIRLNAEVEFRQRVGKTLKLLYNLMGKTTTKDDNGLREVLKKRAFMLKNALAAQKKFPQSQDILDEVVQNLSALRAAVTDDSDHTPRPGRGQEVEKATKITNQRERLFNSLGVEADEQAPKPWWTEPGHRLAQWAIIKFPWTKWVVQLLDRDWIMATLASAHLTLFAAFGLWVWFTVGQFGDCDNFTSDTRVVIIPGVNIRVTSPIRIWFQVLYIVCLVPYLNIVFIGALELLAIRIFESRCFSRAEKTLNLRSFIVLTLLVQVYFILTTELTIHTNRSLLVDSAQEADWTFGQTLAIALIAIPLIDVTNQIWEERDTLQDKIKGLHLSDFYKMINPCAS
ncbi:hypothetical protein CVT25_008823 [Psilocybe cyanescens]|uniref:Uncharacterized protein n=1 Tax=Psilocybe cyanescens TaxID=93625 RepID=A0A409XAH4_PSICY|nr:hypothetical protein CVT25_008823 [Psilocybe cyanescens]